jgi:hypothetical protein
MGFNLDLAESWTMIFYIIGVVVLVIGVLGFFIIEEKENGRFLKLLKTAQN